tara:strand:+ start:25 stop:639 length:615 start_codon:yes stop_codon:yes gene_type:complete
VGKEIIRLFLITIFLSSHLFSHPVIFKGGKVFWVTQSLNYNDIRFGTSQTSNWLIGGRLLEDRNSNESFVLINNNYLLKRWNAPNSQANIYLLSSVGINTKDNKEMGAFGIHGDWENRRYMVMQMMEYFSHNESWVSSTRLSVSPYTVDYTKMSVWLIANYEVTYQDDEYSSTLIPVVRLFKGNYLVEFGKSKDSSFLSLMIHF